MEALNEFLRAKPVINGEQGGWMLKYDELSGETLESRSASVEWQQIEVSSSVYAIFHQLTQSDVCTTDLEFAEKEAGRVGDFINEIISTNYAAFDDQNLSLNSENIIAAILSDGRFVIAENNSGRFDAWLRELYSKI